jgi:hypothetical protein
VSSTSNALVKHVFRSNRIPGKDIVSLLSSIVLPEVQLEPAGASGRSTSGLSLGSLTCAPPFKANPCHMTLHGSDLGLMDVSLDDIVYNHVLCGMAVCLLCRTRTLLPETHDHSPLFEASHCAQTVFVLELASSIRSTTWRKMQS